MDVYMYTEIYLYMYTHPHAQRDIRFVGTLTHCLLAIGVLGGPSFGDFAHLGHRLGAPNFDQPPNVGTSLSVSEMSFCTTSGPVSIHVNLGSSPPALGAHRIHLHMAPALEASRRWLLENS